MPAGGECNCQVKLKILTEGTAIKSLKARSIGMGTSVCLSKGEVHIQILQERGGRRSRGGTPLIVLQVYWWKEPRMEWPFSLIPQLCSSAPEQQLQPRRGSSLSLSTCGVAAGE